ncbi:Glycerophosphoryl diester phosphodiesterase family protein [Nakamurella panacisegetis]|uniref:Glycerophosphoryl diester phosphodiesterase family protein n=2 Tax=Nakamurella panacisegetis TaxID=1090615 RepID=A0A1H0IK77_9ACTN|nr:Glycerophosphoryl diester phosphodiesterase family protein [Nakamurella panacisegetis]
MSVGAIGVGAAAGAIVDRRLGEPTRPPSGSGAVATVAGWAARRGNRYHIGHRGSGDVYPEHSIEGYRAVVAAGIECIEISVGMTSDGTLICMHDATYDRTTTLSGTVASLPSTVLRGGRLDVPQLGPAWAAEPVPRVPYLLDVLRELGGKVVMCIEAKNDDAYPAMIAAIETAGLKDSVIIKGFYSSSRLPQARAAGYPVFGYFGAETDITLERIAALAKTLAPATDCIVLPASGASGLLNSQFVTAAVGTGIPVWIYAAHRRSDAAHFFDLGCRGIVGSSAPYIASDRPIATADTWASGAIAPGEMTRDPSSATYAPAWSGPELHLAAKGTQHFLTLGHFGPVRSAAGSYTVEVEACWPALPSSAADNLTIAFGRNDDSYYEHRLGRGNGYHAILRADGRLELYRHLDGHPDGVQLGVSVATTPASPGQWIPLRLQVTPAAITWTRTDAAGTVTSSDSTTRGGYLHIGRSSTDGEAAFRKLRLS